MKRDRWQRRSGGLPRRAGDRLPLPFPVCQQIDECADLGRTKMRRRKYRVDAAFRLVPLRQHPNQAPGGSIIGNRVIRLDT